jgi:short-chain dehydrogenase/reductase SDR
MRAQQKGKVINITSVAAYMGLPFRGGYSASKGALQLLSESLRMETEQFGICFCTLAPGDVATDIASRRFHTPALEGSPYKQYAEALPLMNADVDNGLPAQDLAQAIYSLLQKEHPKVHYIKGKALERLSVFLKKILPSKCFERLLKRHYRL